MELQLQLHNAELVGFRNRALFYNGKKVFPHTGHPFNIIGYDRAYALYSSLIPDTPTYPRFIEKEDKFYLASRVAYGYFIVPHLHYSRVHNIHTEGNVTSWYVRNGYRNDGADRKFEILSYKTHSMESKPNNNFLDGSVYHPNLNTKPSNTLSIFCFKIYKDDSTNGFEKGVNFIPFELSIRDSGIYKNKNLNSFENSELVKAIDTEGKVVTICYLHNFFKVEIDGVVALDWTTHVLPDAYKSYVISNTSILLYELGTYTTSGKTLEEAKVFADEILKRINQQLEI